ncbi:MAG: type IV secretion protein Rhs, partial [Anaerolinea sp.]|nr:type IV secretion protein Rhs [Anaerolinea sp.]
TGSSALKESYFGDSAGTAEGGNSLNQLRARKNDSLPVQGTVDAASTTVAVAGLITPPARQGRYWAAELPVDNSSGPWAGTVNVYAAKPGGGTSGADLIRTEPARAAQLAKALQVFTYDDDGNLSGDGLWDYQYDAENRLVRMATTSVAATAGYPNKVMQFRYDYMGRRIMKRDDTASGSERRYLYAGWNVIAETDASLAVKRTFTWGLDLVGSLTASGGVGALVQIRDWVQQKTLLPTYDGNGNVASLVNDDGTLAAIYEYDPSGQLLRCEGSYAKDNPFRFSTKWQDEETGLVYYGHRYYSPSMGRFINRDPIAEAGGLNLYGFCGNDGINRWDYLGQSWFSKTWKKLKTWIYKHPIAA